MGEPAVPLNGHAPFARGPTKGRGVRLVRIPRPSAVPRLCLDPRPFAGISPSSFPVEAIQPAASVRAAGLAGRRAGRAPHGAKESEPPCGKIWPWPATARPVDHRPLLDPWGLARACCGPTPPLPRSGRREAGQPGSRPASAVPPEGTRWAGQGDQDRRARDWLGTRQASARRSREHRPDQLGWRPACRPEPGTRPEGGRPT